VPRAQSIEHARTYTQLCTGLRASESQVAEGTPAFRSTIVWRHSPRVRSLCAHRRL
jgi:hypothetical protein